MVSSRRRRPLILAATLAILAVMVVAFGYFEVHTLVVDDRVDESVPAAAGSTWQGSFAGLDHETSGDATVLDTPDGQFVRFDDFRTSNGPDLHVFLVPAGATDVSDAIDLGQLKGNVGAQNYELPSTVDLTRYPQVLVWCVRFGSAFGSAALTPA
ncbi:MAG: hypothetical protein RL238_3644 [Actinomycetota bacterium]|jgi:hypothetical protein